MDFSEERWKETLDKRVRENIYFVYINDDINEYAGYVNYHYNKSNNKYELNMNSKESDKMNNEEKIFPKTPINWVIRIYEKNAF